MPRSEFRLLALFAAFVLSACASPGGEAMRPCPVVGILSDAETLSAFASADTADTALLYRATLSDVSVKCGYRGYKRDASGAPHEGATSFGRVTGTVRFDASILRGAAWTNASVEIPYFVAITRGKKFILAREEFSESIRLGDKPNAARRIEVPINIPLTRDTTGASYEVIVGLSLTPGQLAYNRRQAAR